MTEFPWVTIITPTYNQGQFITETIESVLGQTYKNIEYIVIDAMSTDNTVEVLNRYAGKITKIIREPDAGQSDAIVKGFKLARGELVGWINSDDILYADCVEKIVAAYRNNPEAVLFYNSSIDIISENSSFIRHINVPVINGDLLLRCCNTLVQPGSFYKRETLVKVDYFDKSLGFSMDLDLWLRLLKEGSCINLGYKSIAGYREWGGTKTSTGDVKLLKERKKLLLSHGAGAGDRTILTINFALAKSFIRNFPLVKGICTIFEKILRMMRTMAYYGIASHLPASSSRYTKWCRSVRGWLCIPLFRSAGKNINVEKGAIFGTGAKISIGDNSGIGVNCKLQGDIIIGKNVMMGPEVVFITTSHNHSCADVPMIGQGFSQERPIVISDDVWIGTRCTVLPGVTIGKGVIIGAASVVTKSIPDYAIVAGNPARIIKNRPIKNNIIVPVVSVHSE